MSVYTKEDLTNMKQAYNRSADYSFRDVLLRWAGLVAYNELMKQNKLIPKGE